LESESATFEFQTQCLSAYWRKIADFVLKNSEQKSALADVVTKGFHDV
jgi:hypothetical protein